MRILLTNDDGIRAPGIVALFDALEGLGEIIPIAPLTVQSATSHGVTFNEPLMTSEVEVNDRMHGVAVDGRPADCVKLAISTLWPERFGAGSRPDLLISGMNAGANCGVNVIYSGTVAAAIEGAFLGVPSIAVSLMLRSKPPLFDLAARHARLAIDVVLEGGMLEPHDCININLPPHHEAIVPPPIRVAPMNTHGLVDRYDARQSPSGEKYYWASGDGLDFHSTEVDSDVDTLFKDMTSVTPLQYDLTRAADLARWR
ncbi:MAG: 5'/3'-nucleotidase SurE, partial [Phycisphaerales bacterium]|nr:5'/3'-nucleotidase SurE [Phycisphaerales bacterium]